jgi:hypothetical protein
MFYIEKKDTVRKIVILNRGTKFHYKRDERSETFVLAAVDANMMTLVSLFDGNRWNIMVKTITDSMISTPSELAHLVGIEFFKYFRVYLGDCWEPLDKLRFSAEDKCFYLVDETPKVTQIDLRYGTKFFGCYTNGKIDSFVLTYLGNGNFCLVDINDGSRWRDPVKANEHIHLPSITTMEGLDKVLGQGNFHKFTAKTIDGIQFKLSELKWKSA